MSPFEIGICAGIVWAAILVVWALADATTGEISPWLNLISMVYDGFDTSPRGLFWGGVWAFADGFISGYIISWLVTWLFF